MYRFNRDDLPPVFYFLIDGRTIMRKQKLHRMANYLKKTSCNSYNTQKSGLRHL